MCSTPAKGAPDLGRVVLVDLAAGLGRVEVVAAAVGVERAEQPAFADHLAKRLERVPSSATKKAE